MENMKELNHGTASCYNNDGCRCDDCRKAWADYMRPRIKRYRARKRKNSEVKTSIQVKF